MPKSYSQPLSNQPILVIVESPAKCKKIEEYLGPGYKCLASFGHLRELPSLECINFVKNYQPTYRIIDNTLKKKQIVTLRNAINESKEVILATDDDREGEAIAWHLTQLFDLNVDRTKRIVFHEITKQAVCKALQNPRTIDMHLVEAQQCRQILDLLVGFKISPILWKYISRTAENSLSAGRCQTPALKLIYDNQQEIDKNLCQKVFSIIGYFTSKNLPFELNTVLESSNEEQVIDFLNDSITFPHIYSCSKPNKGYKSPPEPFTTSRLQQVASNELHYSPKETMKLCQTLYEAGHITYMRTDSKVYCAPFLDSVKSYVLKEYGDLYLSFKLDSLSQKEETDAKTKTETNTKGKTSKKTGKEKASEKEKGEVKPQEAHEAIRPTHIEMKDLGEDSKLGTKERKMYHLIWRNTLESCMSPASYYSVTANITAPPVPVETSNKQIKYTYSAEKMDFLGWKILTFKPISGQNEYFQYLQTLGQNKEIPYQKIFAKVTMKNQLLHYTEARLVQLLEEKGIGRPSTFSSLVDKIQERGYVKKQDIEGTPIVCKEYELTAKTSVEDAEIYEQEVTKTFGNEKGKLVIQPIGIMVLEFLMRHFTNIFQYDYTSKMEDALDQVANGFKKGNELCYECDCQLEDRISILNETREEKKIEYQIDESHWYIIGKHGPVIKKISKNDSTSGSNKKRPKTTFLSLKPGLKIDFPTLERGGYKLEDLVSSEKEKENSTKDKSIGEFEGHPVFLKKGKFGLYLSYGEKGTLTKSLSSFGNRPQESITWEEIRALLEQGDTSGSIVRKLSDCLSIRKSKKGEDYLFFKTTTMKKPQFFDIKKFNLEFKEMDYKTCDLELLNHWIRNTYF